MSTNCLLNDINVEVVHSHFPREKESFIRFFPSQGNEKVFDSAETNRNLNLILYDTGLPRYKVQTIRISYIANLFVMRPILLKYNVPAKKTYFQSSTESTHTRNRR